MYVIVHEKCEYIECYSFFNTPHVRMFVQGKYRCRHMCVSYRYVVCVIQVCSVCHTGM